MLKWSQFILIINQFKVSLIAKNLWQMKANSLKSPNTSKKEQFRRQIRAEYLQKYMAKIRTQIHDCQQYKILRNTINSIHSTQNISKETYKQDSIVQKVSELISFANQGSNPAIVALGQLLLDKVITIQTIQSIRIEDGQNMQNDNNQSQEHDLMKIIKFPPEHSNNQGWLAFVRILVSLNYCSQEMIVYCIKTIAKSKSLQSVEFALQVIYILIIDKKMFTINDLPNIIASNPQFLTNSTEVHSSLILNLYDSLMKFSLPSTVLEDSHEIRYYATKILSRSFSSQQVLENTILKNIPLGKISQFLDQKFATKSIWQRTKALKMMNDLLEAIKDFKQYKIDQIMGKMFQLMSKIMHEIFVTSTQIYQQKSGQLGFSHCFSDSKNKTKIEKDLIKFMQEAVYFIQIIVDSFLFSHDCIQVTNELIEKLTLEITLNTIHEGYHKQAKQIKCIENIILQSSSLKNQDEAKIWIVQNVQRIALNLDEKITSASQNIQQNHQGLNQGQVQKFLTLCGIVSSRLHQSQILLNHYQQIGQYDYQI